MNVISKITIKQLCLIFSLISVPILGYGQFKGDTVFVYVENRVEIKVAIPDYEDLKMSDSVVIALDDFQNLLPEIESQLEISEAEQIHYSVGGALTIKPGDPEIIYLNKGGKLSNTGFRDQAVIQGKDYIIFITAADLSNIQDLTLSACMQEVITKLPEQTHWPRSIFYDCTKGIIQEIENKNNEVDFMELNFGAGAGLIKSKWVTDLSLGIRLGLNHKGVQRGPYISSNMIFDFNEESSMNINTFLNAGYAWTLGGKTEKQTMLGVDLGYLIVKQGDLFGENTFKLGINWSPGNLLQVSPQVYITDNFNQIYPGFRIGIEF